jgi:hypothetical protein
MSYDIYLYCKDFLARALEQNLGDWSNADPIDEKSLAIVRKQLAEKGYSLEIEEDDCQEYLHPNEDWTIQVQVFSSEIAFNVPYGDEFEEAIAAALSDAQDLAEAAGLGLHDPQTCEAEPD